MEAVLRHLNNILELLAVSQTDSVREWDRHAAHRAFQWAEYCEQLHSRFQSNPAVRSALESGLNDTNRRLKDTLPSYRPVGFSELGQCQHKLMVYLLRNPSAPHFIVEMLFPDFTSTPQEFQIDQTSLVSNKSAFNLLCGVGLQTEPQVRGKLLGKLLNSLLTRSGNEDYAKSLLESVNRDSAGKADGFYKVIAFALLSSSDESQRCILVWLRDQDGYLDKLCTCLSSKVCAGLSGQCPEFKQLYWGVLKHWASCLEYDVTESVWVTSEGAASFDALVGRFRDVLNSGATLKEETEASLKELKLEDGDFDVKGVSIWTDLIIQLQIG